MVVVGVAAVVIGGFGLAGGRLGRHGWRGGGGGRIRLGSPVQRREGSQSASSSNLWGFSPSSRVVTATPVKKEKILENVKISLKIIIKAV